MRLRVSLALAACAAVAVASPASAADIPLPTGSYLESCKVISFDAATGALQAECDGPSQGLFSRPETPPFNVTGCKEGTIWNDARQLYCFAAAPWGNERVIPRGSYIATCTDRRVIAGALLTARCQNDSGETLNASLDLRPCIWGGDIANYHGGLGCERKALPANAFSTTLNGSTSQGSKGAVVKPVAVEPGVVKPVLVAPLAPPAEEKKKKKDKGERG